MASTLLANASIVDGSGAGAFPGSVLIEDGRISAVIPSGETPPAAATTVDLGSLSLCPGFIDIHSHLDWVLPRPDHAEHVAPFLEQGVTTVVGGNCGISPAPIHDGSVRRLEGLARIAMTGPLDYRWRSLAEFLDQVDEMGPALNLAVLAGHSALRYAASSTPRGQLTPEELKKTGELLREALDQGAAGVSFGLGYDPGMYSPLSELESLCATAAQAGKPATVHLKALSRISPCYPVWTPRAHNVKALEEMLDVARATGVSLQLSHFIFVGRRSWGTADECLALVDEARRDFDVMIDAFPYTCGNTTILAPFPYWFLADLERNFQSGTARARLRLELELGFRLVGFIYRDFQVMDAAAPGWEDAQGKRIDRIARERGMSPFAALVELARASRGAATMLFHTYSGEPGREEPIEAVLSRPYCLIETDAVVKGRGWPNPAALGTFPRVLGRMARERGLMRMEDAVKRMTHLSAQRFGLKDRGLIAPGMAADLVVFVPETIVDDAPEDRPAGRPRGISTVYVNGVAVVEEGRFTGLREGRSLRG